MAYYTGVDNHRLFFMVDTTPTGETGMYVKAYDYATQVIITARYNEGDDIVTLDYLYDVTGANTPATKTAVRWGRNAARVAGLLVNTDTRGVYKFAR